MSLYSRAWVRRVRRLGALPARSWRLWSTYFGWLNSIWRVSALACLAILAHSERRLTEIAAVSEPPALPQGCLHFFTAWLLIVVLARVWQIQEFLSSPQVAGPLLPLPANDAFAFAFSRERILRFSTWIVLDTLAFFLAAFGVHLLWTRPIWLAGAVLIVWVAHGALALLLSLLVFSLSKRSPFYGFGVLLLSLMVFAIALVGSYGEVFQRRLAPAFPATVTTLQRYTPVGWSTSWAQWMVAEKGDPPPAGTAAGLALLLCSLPWSCRALRRRFRFRGYEEVLFEPEEDWEADPQPLPKRDAPASIEADILSRDWLALPDEKLRSRVERFLHHGLTARQRVLAHDLASGKIHYATSYRILAAISVLFFLLFRFYPGMTGWLVGGGGLLALFLQLPLADKTVHGIDVPASLSNGDTAFVSLLPVGISELRTLFNSQVFRCGLLTLPIFLWASLCFSLLLNRPLGAGLFSALVFWLGLLAITPCWFIFKVSRFTRDTSTSVRLTCGFFGLGLIGALLLMALPVVCLGGAAWWWSFLNLLLLALFMRGFDALYLRWYRCARFDLITTAQSS
ncbi:MAG TPA: hypothetical protein VNQ90_12860 [Chthoniobacteraceae bacterium]|nr:hypothetical protein [Chthoniobacteraceae bacterium]